MSEKQTKNTKEILSNVWNWKHTEDGGRIAVPNPHPVIKKEKMLQEIQDKIGDKTLSRGCKLSYNNRGVLGYYETYYTILHCHNKKVGYMLENDMGKCLSYYDCNIKYFPKELVEDTSHIYKKDIAGFKVIGHPVMIGDVLDWIESRGNVYDNISDNGGVIRNWKQKRKPLSDQSEQCIHYIYSLLPTEVRK